MKWCPVDVCEFWHKGTRDDWHPLGSYSLLALAIAAACFLVLHGVGHHVHTPLVPPHTQEKVHDAIPIDYSVPSRDRGDIRVRTVEHKQVHVTSKVVKHHKAHPKHQTLPIMVDTVKAFRHTTRQLGSRAEDHLLHRPLILRPERQGQEQGAPRRTQSSGRRGLRRLRSCGPRVLATAAPRAAYVGVFCHRASSWRCADSAGASR